MKVSSIDLKRRLPIGAEIIPEAGVHFRVWAPEHSKVQVIVENKKNGKKHNPLELTQDAVGYFSGIYEEVGEGSLYRYKIDDNGPLLPDPASRFQPEGPHGPSAVTNPDKFKWTDTGWKGPELKGQIIYEMHFGTYTKEGTFRSASKRLQDLADLGITLIEIMPIADFPGRFGWGYDGVNLFAPSRLYGKPDDFKSFVNEAHLAGLGVILDVVYNHLGPDGNYLSLFSKFYFSKEHKTDWGDAINFDGENSAGVREFFISNATYWIDEFHLDGLRFDATQDIHDNSSEHILSAINKKIIEKAAGKKIFTVAENEPQNVKLIKITENNGYNVTALWNDDFHHSAMVALTGKREAYYTDYLGKPQEFISMLKYGFLYQGQYYKWQGKRRGSPTYNLEPAKFINYIQNHDQIANSGRGYRCHFSTSWGRYKAITALLLLGPGTPMLFQGQEFASSSPFYYFADHKPELAELVKKGRTSFLSQFRSLKTPEIQAWLPIPSMEETFTKSKLDFSEQNKNGWIYKMHKELIKLRRETPVFNQQKNWGVDGAVLGEEAFVIRFFDDFDDDKLLIINLGVDLHLDPSPEPLLAPYPNKYWDILWSTENPDFGGLGTAPLDTEENWRIPGHAAVVLTSKEIKEVNTWTI